MDFNIGAEITAEDRDAIIVRRTRTDFTSQKACTERVGSQRNKVKNEGLRGNFT